MISLTYEEESGSVVADEKVGVVDEKIESEKLFGKKTVRPNKFLFLNSFRVIIDKARVLEQTYAFRASTMVGWPFTLCAAERRSVDALLFLHFLRFLRLTSAIFC